MKKIGQTIFLVLISGAVAISLFVLIENRFAGDRNNENLLKIPSAKNTTTGSSSSRLVAFAPAANAVTPAVVHIKTLYNASAQNAGNPYQELYGMPPQSYVPVMASGSGVIITDDGYIATNNHVVENASAIEVIFPDNRMFSGQLIGRDPNTDIALLKVKASHLPVVKLGNSDEVQVGDWALAVGYPFSLNTTVTAGIISAKGRSIGILGRPGRESRYQSTVQQSRSSPIESFIQTDAAINPGNSGGALVNTNGELIGINAAIASQTGSYAGYGFAIPVNLAKRIWDDLMKYGEVKRGYLGVTFPAPSMEDYYLKKQGIMPDSVKGVYIIGVQSGSAAEAAGIQRRDIIQSVDGVEVSSSTEFAERIARHHPDDIVQLSLLREGKLENVTVILQGEKPSAKADKSTQLLQDLYYKLGASFAPLTDELRQHYQLNSGIVVTEIRKGGFFEQVGIPRGTIITMINGVPVNNPKDIDTVLTSAKNSRIRIDGIAPDGSPVLFTFSLGA